MNLDTIRNFDWYNEPEFSFSSGALIIKAQSETDFWQDKRNNVKKNDGHFFFAKYSGDVELTIRWQKPKRIEELCHLWCNLDNRRGGSFGGYLVGRV